VSISPEAFASPGLLRAVIAHEGVHVRQIAEGRFHAFEGSPADFVNEIEALRAGLARPTNQGVDPALDAQRSKWSKQIDELIEKLVGTPYHDRVRKTPPDYTLLPLDKCPSGVCFLK
jgi:hypothetical protein